MEYLTLETARSWIKGAALLISENAPMLTQLDTAIGDGDHGENMMRGFTAVERKLETGSPPDLAALFKLVGMTLLSSVGGASGPLYGGFFLELAKSSAGKEKLGRIEFGQILDNGLADIRRRGKAQLGDKTMVDAWSSALEGYRSSASGDLGSALLLASDRAKAAAEGTVPMLARKGRASYLGERSIGHQDPGATSTWLLLKALASVCNSSGS
ncbi:MAG TPA: dihydroxyacetone kinase subunit DhaL [Terriglobales bacterium]|nr:dihydroxyacetone kinase subunit DhaL [Terriglobales bacterium]